MSIPLIPTGNELRKTENKTETSKAIQAGPSAEAGNEDEIKILRRVQREGVRRLTPKEQSKLYQAGLKAVGLNKEEARSILDTLLTKGHYTRSYRISDKTSVVLRTRNYYDVQRTLRYTESEAPSIPLHVNDLMFRYNLAASLASFGGTKFEFPSDEDPDGTAREDAFDKRLSYIYKLPTPIANLLSRTLADFDDKLNAVLTEGAVEDF